MKLLREYIRQLMTEAKWPGRGSWDEWGDDSEYDAKLRLAFVNSAQHGLQLAKSLGADIAEPMQYIVDKLNEAYELRYELQDEAEQNASGSRATSSSTNRQQRIEVMWQDIKQVFTMMFHENLKGTDEMTAYENSRLPQYMNSSEWALTKGIPSTKSLAGLVQESFENLAEWAGIKI